MTRLLSTAVMMLVEALVREMGMARVRQVRRILRLLSVFPVLPRGESRRVRWKSQTIYRTAISSEAVTPTMAPAAPM